MAKEKGNTQTKKESSASNVMAEIMRDTINSDFKGLDVASFINTPEYVESVDDWLSTGSTTLDLAISNRPNGGYPLGRIIEIYGATSSGKSLLAYSVIKQAQLRGGVGVVYDTERSTSNQNIGFLEAIGVDPTRFIHVRGLNTIEDVFQSIESLIIKSRERDKKIPIAIVIDSIMGATTKVEMESEYDKDGFATSKAIILSKAMRKITDLIAKEKILLLCINQERTRLGISFGDASTTSGGSAVGFHSSVRIKVKIEGKIKAKINGQDEIVGIKTSCNIKKNRVGPPFRSASFNTYFNSGIDDSGDWFEKLATREVIKKVNNRTYSYIDEATGQVYEFSEKEWRELLNKDQKLRDSAYKKLCELCIMKYRHEQSDSDNIKVEAETEDNDQ